MNVPLRKNVTVGGSRTAYWEYGDPSGDPLILIHGFRGDHHGLQGIAQHMKRSRVIVPDLPGFGESERLHAPHNLAGYSGWLREFVPAITSSPYSILGHSFGSLVVSQAVHYGLDPRTLILVNPISAPALEGPRAVLTKLAIAYYAAGARLPNRIADRLLRDPLIVRGMSEAMAKTRDPKLRAWIHQQHASYFSAYTDREALGEAFVASVSHTVRDFVSAFTMPTQIIAGEKDDITPLLEQLRLASAVADSEFRVIPGSGHLVHYEATVECAELVESFAARRGQE